MRQTLYISYFGFREPLVQTQVLPYLREIAKLDDLGVHFLTFEPNLNDEWSSEQIQDVSQALGKENITWHRLQYHKWPSGPATFFDVLNGARFTIGLSRKIDLDFIHARGHIPMMTAILASKITKSRIIFDIRGLMAEEYADANVWKDKSIFFRLIKRIERKGIERASEIVVLTNRMRDYLIEEKRINKKKIEVIPCCVDFVRIDNFDAELLQEKRFELVYAGSVSGLYLLDEMGKFFLILKRLKTSAYFRVLTSSPPEFVNEIFGRLGIPQKDYQVAKVAPDEVPKHLKRADLGISFRKSTFSQIASSPTKIPEYLACGLPVVSNYGIGDTDTILENENVGISLQRFDEAEMVDSANEIMRLLDKEGINEKCREVAHRYFDLVDVGGRKYKNVYSRLMKL